MRYNAQGQEVADDDPTGVSDTPPAPLAPAPAAPPANNEVMTAYQQELLRQSAENRRLAEENAALRRTPAAPPTPEDERRFFDTPRSTVAEIVRKEISEQIAPLNAFTRNLQRNDAYNSLKAQMRAKPDQFPYITISAIEGYVDHIMANVAQPDANSIIAAYNQAVGYHVSTGGKLDATSAPNNPPPPAPREPTMPLPPHARSTPPAPGAPSGNGKVKLRELSENERIIARHNRYTDKEYLFWTEHVTPKEVGNITPEEVTKRIKELFG